MSSKNSQKLHAHACRVVFRIVGVEALAVRYVHTPEGHGKFLPAAQCIRTSGAVPEHELITGSACGEISVVEKDACARAHRTRHVPAAREHDSRCQDGSCAERATVKGLVLQRANA